jgi:hypothetical protein
MHPGREVSDFVDEPPTVNGRACSLEMPVIPTFLVGRFPTF